MKAIATRAQYKRALLIPLSIAFAILLAIGFIGASAWQEQLLEKERLDIKHRVRISLDHTIKTETEKLKQLLETLIQTNPLTTDFRSDNRTALLSETSRLFDHYRLEHNVTHFYLITPDRKVFLRAHMPSRFGDQIDRSSLLEAERTGMMASSVENGPYGMFTVRVVAPWRDSEQNLLGYIELGVEIEKALSQISEMNGTSIFVLLNKSGLDRNKWELGQQMLGRAPDWDWNSDYALTGMTTGIAPGLLRQYLSIRSTSNHTVRINTEQLNGQQIEFNEWPLKENDKDAGIIIAARDTSLMYQSQRQFTTLIRSMALALWCVTMLIGNRILNQVYARMVEAEHDRDNYRERTKRDSLTSLFNQHEFYQQLDRDIEQCRDTNSSLVTFMLDIDHFKGINDTFGHRAGDDVLRIVAQTILANVRPSDMVARYGGEEFAVSLPRISVSDAWCVAERIRKQIEDREFVSDGKSVRATISIGAAAFPQQGNTAAALVIAADHALYIAKTEGRNRIRLAEAESNTSPQPSGASQEHAPTTNPTAQPTKTPYPSVRGGQFQLS